LNWPAYVMRRTAAVSKTSRSEVASQKTCRVARAIELQTLFQPSRALALPSNPKTGIPASLRPIQN